MTEAKSRRGNGKSKGCTTLFFLPFAAAGCAIIWFLGLYPFLMSQAAQDWVAVPCVITHSEVTSSTSDGSTTYGVEIHFSYEYQDRSYESETYGFTKVKTSGRTSKAAAVARHPEGSTSTCYLDPEDPSRAVIDRALGADTWWALFGLPFAAIGLGGIWFTWRKPRLRTRAISKQAGAAFRAKDTGDDDAPSSGGLDPGTTPGRKFFGMLVFALVWNGIIGTIAYLFFTQEGMDGGIEWVPTIFLGIFGLVGVGILLIGVPYQFLAMFNPMPDMRIVDGVTRVGGRCKLEWELSGRHDRLLGFTIELVGREIARYRRGTNTYTDKHEFHKVRLFEGQDPADTVAGSCELQIPEGLVGSFNGGNNRIEWELQVRGDIPTWPDLKVDFPLRVGPTEAR